MFTIIEDCSPYYIRFTHTNIEKVIDICEAVLSTETTHKKFLTLDTADANNVLSASPINEIIPLRVERVTMFCTEPGASWRAHKDGFATKCSFNYSIRILDDKSETTWYTDEELAMYEIYNPLTPPSREVLGFNKDNHVPACTLHAQPLECMLINVDIFHAWDNSQSSNERVMLTLRAVDLSTLTFEQARLKLFGI
ncbi:hypothetical protein UFOVP71_142 [uncultured Caudovirales phage]|uniref:Uncharacterized protein n=1 Tax=uncultured Caudovirales phage TaxID=2100421 RepID=A0A6J5TBF5_9CAUD|nr:hypothetical protein UFOVP71_142 [uncultured Caudovirales phage]